MNKFTKSLADLFKTKRVLVLLSLVLSFLIWYSLTVYYNPVSTRTIKDVPIMFDTSETAISGMGLEIVSYNIDSVDVVITGKTANVQRVTASDITVTPSMSSITAAGDYEVALNYTKAMMSDFDVVSIKPNMVKLSVDSVVSRDYSVIATASGATAAEDLICETPTVTDTAFRTLNVKGALSVVNRIDKVVARADVNATLSETTEYEAEIVLFDKDGKEIDKSGLTLSFDSTMVTVPISKVSTLPLHVVFTNAPSNPPLGYSIDVSTVEVIGEPKVIDELARIELLPIDYGTITPDNVKFECELNLPAGVRANDGREKVTVTFDFTGVKKAVKKVQNLNFTDFDSSLGAVKNGSLQVTVYGISTELDSLKSEDLTLNVSLKDYTSKGSYTVPATVTVSSKYKSVWVSTLDKTYRVTITIG